MSVCLCVQDVELIDKSMAVIEGRAHTVDISMSIHNAQRTFATTLSHVISMYVSLSLCVCLSLCLSVYMSVCVCNRDGAVMTKVWPSSLN